MNSLDRKRLYVIGLRVRFSAIIAGVKALRQAIVVSGVVLCGAGVVARQAPSRLYTTEQADAGRRTYQTECARCHGAGMQGGIEEPPLAGARFVAKWRNRTAHDLLNFIQTRMPPQSPGSLGEEANIEIVAHILRANGAPSGPERLTSTTDATIGSAATDETPPAPGFPAAGHVQQTTEDRLASTSFEHGFTDAALATADPTPTPAHTGFGALVHETISDFKTFPRRRSTWVILGVGGGLALLAHPADDHLNAHLAGSRAVDRFFAPGKYLGGGAVMFGVPVGLYAI